MAKQTFYNSPDQRFEASGRVRYNGTDGIVWIERRRDASGCWLHWGKQHMPIRATKKQVVNAFGGVYRTEATQPA